MVDPDEIPEIPTIHLENTPLIDLFHEVALYYSKADVVSLGTDNEKAKLDVGPIKRKDIAFNYTYAGEEVTVYEVTGAQLKKYMEVRSKKIIAMSLAVLTAPYLFLIPMI